MKLSDWRLLKRAAREADKMPKRCWGEPNPIGNLIGVVMTYTWYAARKVGLDPKSIYTHWTFENMNVRNAIFRNNDEKFDVLEEIQLEKENILNPGMRD